MATSDRRNDSNDSNDRNDSDDSGGWYGLGGGPGPLGPGGMGAALLGFIFVIVLAAHLFSSSGRGALGGGARVDELATNEFVSAVRDGRVSSVTYKATDGSLSGSYWPSKSDKDEGNGPVDFTSSYVGNDSLQELMAKHPDTTFTVETSDGFGASLIATVLPTLLIAGMLVYFVRQVQAQNGRTMSFGRATRARTSDKSRPKVKFEDVAGVDEAVEELKEVRDFLREPERYQKMGAKIPRGILLVGPPGTGKTLLAKAVAGEASVPFFSISGSDFVEMFVGVGASRVRDLFKQAKDSAPSIIFIDELDAVGRQRGTGLGGGHDEREQTSSKMITPFSSKIPFSSKVFIIKNDFNPAETFLISCACFNDPIIRLSVFKASTKNCSTE